MDHVRFTRVSHSGPASPVSFLGVRLVSFFDPRLLTVPRRLRSLLSCSGVVESSHGWQSGALGEMRSTASPDWMLAATDALSLMLVTMEEAVVVAYSELNSSPGWLDWILCDPDCVVAVARFLSEGEKSRGGKKRAAMNAGEFDSVPILMHVFKEREKKGKRGMVL